YAVPTLYRSLAVHIAHSQRVSGQRPRQHRPQQHPVVGGVRLVAQHHDGSGVAARPQPLDQPVGRGTVADDDDALHRATSSWAGSIRTALTLNSGIRLRGSSAPPVSRFARPSPGKWNGRNTVSVRMVATTRTRASALPRGEVTRASAPSASPARSAVSGWTSTNTSGAASLSSSTRRVCAPDWYCASTRPVVAVSGNAARGVSAGSRCSTGANRARPSG